MHKDICTKSQRSEIFPTKNRARKKWERSEKKKRGEKEEEKEKKKNWGVSKSLSLCQKAYWRSFRLFASPAGDLKATIQKRCNHNPDDGPGHRDGLLKPNRDLRNSRRALDRDRFWGPRSCSRWVLIAPLCSYVCTCTQDASRGMPNLPSQTGLEIFDDVGGAIIC